MTYIYSCRKTVSLVSCTSKQAGRYQSTIGHYAIVSLFSFIMLIGCSGNSLPTYSVEGTVTYNGQSVPTGWVIFLSSDKKRSFTAIDLDGHYQTELPAGKYLVGVSAPRESNKTGMEAFDERSLLPYVPHRFGHPQSSGLSASIEATDENKIDFALKKQQRRSRRR